MASFGLNQGASLGEVPSGYGSQYDQLFAANPYRNLTYHKSLWQQVASALGFRTDADRWREDAQVNAAEYDAGIYSMMQQNQYNSPDAQADRMRAAGMNPDLQGVGDVADAAQPAEDPNGMSSNLGDEFTQFGESLMSIFSRAMVTYKDFLSIDQIRNVVDAGNIDNAKNMLGTIDGIIEGAFTADDLASPEAYASAGNALLTSLSEDAELPWESSKVYSYGFNKRQRKQFYDVARTRLNSILTDKKAYQNLKDRIDNMNSAKQGQTSPFYSDSQSEDSSLNVIVRGARKAQREAFRLSALASKYQAGVNEQEQRTLYQMGAGGESAQAQVSDYQTKKIQNEWHQACSRIKKDMLSELESMAKRGDGFAKALLFNWALDDLAKINLGASANLSLGLNFGANFGRSIADVFSKTMP